MIRERIISGDYPPAAHLTEQELADASGVSRTPVREALRRLQAEGFVKVVANLGAVVTEWSESDARDVFELRSMLEPYGAARAAQRITPQGIEELRALAQQQFHECEQRAPGYMDRVAALNNQFHLVLHGFAASPRLSTLMRMLIEAPLIMNTFAHYDPPALLRSANHHLEIVSALEAGNADWAASIMLSHIHAAQNSALGRSAKEVQT